MSVFPILRPCNYVKFSYKSTRCIFLAYSSQNKGYKCYDPFHNKIYLIRRVKFSEHSFPYEDMILVQSKALHLVLLPLLRFHLFLFSLSVPHFFMILECLPLLLLFYPLLLSTLIVHLLLGLVFHLNPLLGSLLHPCMFQILLLFRQL